MLKRKPTGSGRGLLAELKAKVCELKKGLAAAEKEKALLQAENVRMKRAIARMTHGQREVIQRERLHALGQMSSGIVHDFNNALTPILGASDFLISNPDILQSKDDTLGLLDSIRTAARDAKNMVRRLRGFYRPDESADVQLLDVNPLIEQAIQLTQPSWANQATAKGIKIAVIKNLSSVPPIRANDSQVREILANVILNAVDAMPEGGTITISTTHEKKWVAIEVCDTGTGMTEEVRQRCFEPFFSTKGRNGTGMGLAIVYGVVKKYDGRIKVTSAEGRGSSFKFFLPAFGDEPAGVPPVQSGEQSVKVLRVLVVDDEPASRDIVTRCLMSDGHSVATASSGKEALEKCEENAFDVIFLDFVMPGLCGSELAGMLRNRLPSAQVILMTGSFDVLPDGRCPEGFSTRLDKPVTQADIREAVWKAITETPVA